MIMVEVKSYAELSEKIKNEKRTFLLLYKGASEKSNCAFSAISNVINDLPDTIIYYADVDSVRDIHPNYKITSVPTLIEFANANMKSIVKGCHGESYYKTIFARNAFKASVGEGKPQKNVVIYSTPSCHHCTNLKNYLKENNIRFRDIDVSLDQNAAKDMVRKSGQQGVPQTDINGQVIIGFDKAKINKLLDIKAL